jgi:riboflavin kinase / FMN adenylyltransferase
MRVVNGVDALPGEVGPVFVVIGVFDGLHLGHRYLLEHLVAEAARREAAPTVITFDHHPDEVLTGSAPPLLIDPDERLQRLDAAGVALTVVQHFDDALRHTPYDAFIERVRARADLSGFLMTPDAAFGYERQGTPAAVAALGARDGFDVVVIPPFTLEGRPVRSSEIREAIASADLAAARVLLGRALTYRGAPDTLGRVAFAMPMAVPPDGPYACLVDGHAGRLRLDRGVVTLDRSEPDDRPLTIELIDRVPTAAR